MVRNDDRSHYRAAGNNTRRGQRHNAGPGEGHQDPHSGLPPRYLLDHYHATPPDLHPALRIPKTTHTDSYASIDHRGFRDRARSGDLSKPLCIPDGPVTSENHRRPASGPRRPLDVIASARYVDPQIPSICHGRSSYRPPPPVLEVEWSRSGTQEVTILKNEYTAYKERVARDHLQIVELKEKIRELETGKDEKVQELINDNKHLKYKKGFFEGRVGDLEHKVKALENQLKENEVVEFGLNGAVQKQRATNGVLEQRIGEMQQRVREMQQRVGEMQQMQHEIRRLQAQVEWFREQLERTQNGGGAHRH